MDIQKFHYLIFTITFITLFLSLYFTLDSLNLKRKYERAEEKELELLFKSERKLTVSRIFLLISLALLFAWFYFKII